MSRWTAKKGDDYEDVGARRGYSLRLRDGRWSGPGVGCGEVDLCLHVRVVLARLGRVLLHDALPGRHAFFSDVLRLKVSDFHSDCVTFGFLA